MQIPVYDMRGSEVCKQYREDGRHPSFYPRGCKISECKPYVERLTERGVLLVCEGPTDAMAAGKLPLLSEYGIVGAWSASTIPPRDWWLRECCLRATAVVSCGDNDPAGQAFNQKIANVVGSCYALHWPPDRQLKWDIKDEIEKTNENTLKMLIDVSLARQPLVASKKQERIYKNNRREMPGLISRLVEDAGGRLAHQMSNGSAKYFCPLHDDREDASLTVDDKTGSWCCWAGCCRISKGGPLQFIMAWKGFSYQDSVAWLQSQKG